MAAGGCDRDVDTRVTCSICLEPYKGRRPKLLPCFHTFCSPCLTQLVDRDTARPLQPPEDKDGSQRESPVTITCPTCRTSSPLPPGGVASFQTNFYLDDGDDVRHLLCDLCEEGQEAKYTCSACKAYFCSRCRKSHNRLCKPSLVSEVKAVSGPGDESNGEAAKRTRGDKIQMLEDVLKKLAEEEKRLGQERRDREHDIHVRYATLLRHAGEARDASLAVLRDVTQALSEALQADVTLARDILSGLKQERGGRGATSQSSACSADALTEANRRHFEELLRKREDEALLRVQPSDRNTEAVLQSHRDFMGTVVSATDTNQTDPPASDDDQSPDGSFPGTQPTTREKQDQPQDVDIKGLVSKLDRTEQLLIVLQNQNTLLCRDLATLHDKNAKVDADVTSLQTTVTSLGDAGNKDRDDLTSLQRDHVSVRDKNAVLCADMQQLRSDLSTVRKDQGKLVSDVNVLQTDQKDQKTNLIQLQTDHNKLQTDHNKLQTDHNKLQTKLQTDINKLQTDHNKLQTDIKKLQTDHNKLQTDHNKLQIDHNKLQTDHNKLQTDHNKLQNDHNKLQTDHNKLQTDHNKLQTDHNKLQNDHNKLQTDHNKLQTDHNKLQTDHNKLQTDHNKLQTDHNKLQTDHNKLQTDHNKLETKQNQMSRELGTLTTTAGLGDKHYLKLEKDLLSLQDSLKKDGTAIATLETEMSKFNICVAFCAIMKDTVKLAGEQTVICDRIICSEGGGYDNETGIFTAPVSGIYCFMANSSRRSNDFGEICQLAILTGDKLIAYLLAKGTALSTCHTVVQVKAGQKVWLCASGEDNQQVTNQYFGNWMTTFTGMLIRHMK